MILVNANAFRQMLFQLYMCEFHDLQNADAFRQTFELISFTHIIYLSFFQVYYATGIFRVLFCPLLIIGFYHGSIARAFCESLTV